MKFAWRRRRERTMMFSIAEGSRMEMEDGEREKKRKICCPNNEGLKEKAEKRPCY
jgi:hypothetical protein